MAQDQTNAAPTAAAGTKGEIPLKAYLRNPVKRFGGLPLESQLHDPLIGNFIDDSPTANNAFVSMSASNPLSLLFSMDRDEDINDATQLLNGWLSNGDMCSYTVLAMHDPLAPVLEASDPQVTNPILACLGRQPTTSPLCFVRQHTRSAFSKKRIVYGLPDDAVAPNGDAANSNLKQHVGAPIFNVRRSLIGGNPTHYVYLGSHESRKDVPDTHPLYKRPFLVMKTNHHQTDLALNFKFTATLTSIRTPTGDAAVDSVMAVERKSQLVVLGSAQLRDLFVFLRLGGDQDKWRWKNEHAPGMLIAKARPASAETVNSVLVGPETMKIDVAAGVDSRIALAAVLAAISHYQTYTNV